MRVVLFTVIICRRPVIVAKIVEEWMPVDVHNEELYRIDYKDCQCHHPKVVVERARSRLHECK